MAGDDWWRGLIVDVKFISAFRAPPNNTTPHPSGCIYGTPLQWSTCTPKSKALLFKKRMVGVQCRFLNELTVRTVRANGRTAVHTHRHTHVGVNTPCADMSKPQTQTAKHHTWMLTRQLPKATEHDELWIETSVSLWKMDDILEKNCEEPHF